MYQQNPNPTGSLFLSALLALIFVVDGRRGFKQAWPVALVAGGSFAITQYLVSNFWSYKLCDIIAAVVSVLAVIGFMRVWQPERSIPPVIAGGSMTDSRCDVLVAPNGKPIKVEYALNWASATGTGAFLSPVVGWFGVAITGTDAGSNALFGGLQVTAAQQLGASPFLVGASNSSGGVMAKMISPQNLAIGTAAAGLVGREGDLFRKVFGWSLLLLLVMCVLAYLQSTPVLGWMVP